ncbi:hypothetical protein BDV39DRAFT_185169 [Aspergillus sergii]|uniref:Uncharacterized protein n=1 Tax=Aspergillus sergii TaxID=1034303 RepID=A0A5N6WMA2_9EURO|nr:hypothetical protein BDV39DRAFT_185169 [Aspergillus sergii]
MYVNMYGEEQHFSGQLEVKRCTPYWLTLVFIVLGEYPSKSKGNLTRRKENDSG